MAVVLDYLKFICIVAFFAFLVDRVVIRGILSACKIIFGREVHLYMSTLTFYIIIVLILVLYIILVVYRIDDFDQINQDNIAMLMGIVLGIPLQISLYSDRFKKNKF